MPKPTLCNPKPFLYDLTKLIDIEDVKSRCNQEIQYIYNQCGVELIDDNFLGDKTIAQRTKNQFTKYVREIKKNFPANKIQPWLIGKDVNHNASHIAVEFMKMHPDIMKKYHNGQIELKSNKKASLNSLNVAKLLDKTRYYLCESSNPSHWVLGLAIATGRRFNEIFLISELEYESGISPYQLGILESDNKWNDFVASSETIDCIGFEKLHPNDLQDEIVLPVFFSSEMILECFIRLRDYVSGLAIKNENTSYHKSKISAVARKELLGDILQWESKENFTTHKLRSVYSALIAELFNQWLLDDGQSPVDGSLGRQYALRDKSNQADHYIAWHLSNDDKQVLWNHYTHL